MVVNRSTASGCAAVRFGGEPITSFDHGVRSANSEVRGNLSTAKSRKHCRRAQETLTGEEPVMAKSTPASLVSRRLSADQSPMLENYRLSRNSDFTSAERSVREMTQRSSTGQPVREIQNPLTEVKLNHHNLQISDTRYDEKVFAIIQQTFNCPEDDQMLDQRINVLIW